MGATVILTGRVGRDAETRFTTTGTQMTTFSVATTKRWKKDGERQEKTTWWNVSTFGKLAEVCAQYITKGMLVEVAGEPEESHVYEDRRSGEWKANMQVTASKVEFHGGKSDGGASGGQQSEPAASIEEEEIPF